jgi:hypothetical protein
MWDRPMKSRFPILVEYVAACLATALALSTAIAFKYSDGLTDFIAIATSLSLAGLITIITVIPGLVFGIIYWLFAWLIAGRAADSEGALVRANSTTESSSSASAWTAWFSNDVVPRN